MSEEDERRFARWPGVVLAVCAAGSWLAVSLSIGPRLFQDTKGYLALADAFARFSTISFERPDRMPGYPVFLLGCHALAHLIGAEPMRLVVVVQTLLLSGLGTYLVYSIGARIGGGKGMVGVLAALLFATDPNVHLFGASLLTEALTIVLAAAMASLRLRDGHWRRAGWITAGNTLIRPNFLTIACALALFDALRLRRASAAVAPAGPSILVFLSWIALGTLGGAHPLTAFRQDHALCDFGAIYEADLWQRLPDSPYKQVLAQARADGRDGYQAAAIITGSPTPWNPGTAWHPLREIANQVMWADPAGYVRMRARIARVAFETAYWRWDVLRVLFPSLAGLAWLYPKLLYGSAFLFVPLLLGALWNGLGWPEAAAPCRALLAPYIVAVFATTSWLAMGTDEVSRLVISTHPFCALFFALGAGAILSLLGERIAKRS
jgi:hypothetical protein